MPQTATPIRRALLLALVPLALAACQPGPDPAARARPPEAAPPVARIDPDACWTQARVALPGGGAEDRGFAVPCPGALTPALWSSVQRALAARGLYAGPITGASDAATAEAVRRFQAPLGLDSPVLSLEGARRLGLIVWPQGQL